MFSFFQLTQILQLSYLSHFRRRESLRDSMPQIRRRRWRRRRRRSPVERRPPSWPGWPSYRRKASGSRPRRWSRCSHPQNKRPTGELSDHYSTTSMTSCSALTISIAAFYSEPKGRYDLVESLCQPCPSDQCYNLKQL